MTVQPADKISCYLELYKNLYASFYKRREFEWKFNFALWTPLAILIGFGLKGEITSTVFSNNPEFTWIAHVVVLVLYMTWSHGLHRANYIDKNNANKYEEALVSFVSGTATADPQLGSVKPVTKVPFKKLVGWSPLVQIIITAGLLLINALILVSVP